MLLQYFLSCPRTSALKFTEKLKKEETIALKKKRETFKQEFYYSKK